MIGEIVIPGLLIAVLLAAALHDLLWRRLPNWLTGGGAVAAFMLALAGGGPEALLQSLAGWLVGIAVLLPLFIIRGMGAGDVKLLGAVGAFLGPAQVLIALIWGGLIGGLFALFVLIRQRQLVPALVSLWATRSLPRLDDPNAVTLPYGVVIAAGGLIAVLLGRGGGL